MFDAARVSSTEAAAGGKTLLHFGAIDWQSAVYLNGNKLGNHTGGYVSISTPLPPLLTSQPHSVLS